MGAQFEPGRSRIAATPIAPSSPFATKRDAMHTFPIPTIRLFAATISTRISRRPASWISAPEPRPVGPSSLILAFPRTNRRFTRMKIPRKTERGHKARIAASLAASAVVIASALVVALLVSRSPPEEEGLAAPNPVPEEAPIPPLSGPPTIAIQAGHWQASELPDELAKLRSSTGASYGKLREVDINRAVSDSLAKMVEAEGWRPPPSSRHRSARSARGRIHRDPRRLERLPRQARLEGRPALEGEQGEQAPSPSPYRRASRRIRTASRMVGE